MAVKKPVAKAAAKKAPVKVAKPSAVRQQTFDMPVEVKEWIEQAGSRLKSLQSKIDRLEAEIKELKSYKKWAEHKILGSSYE